LWDVSGRPWDQIVALDGRQFTSGPVNHFSPSINDYDEVVWHEYVGGYTQIFSSLRGQITFGNYSSFDPFTNNAGEIVWVSEIGGQRYFFSNVSGLIAVGDSPSINDLGEIVFTRDGQIYKASPVPEPSTILLFVCGLAGIAGLGKRFRTV